MSKKAYLFCMGRHQPSSWTKTMAGTIPIMKNSIVFKFYKI
jgi:hypothetical protein